MRVPFSDTSYDLATQIAVQDVLKSGWASKGRYCDEFQAALEEYLGKGVHVALVNNGSSALMVALLANGVKAGDTVLVPDFTYVATATVPAILGCKIVPVDADPEDFNWTVVGGQRTYDIDHAIFTDVAGLPSLATSMPSRIIEDAAEALGAEVNSKRIGSNEHLTTFSFQATKVLNTVEGGAIASTDEELIDKCRRIADYGRTKERYVHDLVGMNFRMTDITAAIGLVGLEDLDDNLKRRAEIAKRYQDEIPSLTFQKVPSYVTRHSWWAVIGLARNMAEQVMLLKKFRDAEIDVREPWMPIHIQPCFPELNRNPEFHNARRIWLYGLMLPIFNSMSDDQVSEVIKVANS